MNDTSCTVFFFGFFFKKDSIIPGNFCPEEANHLIPPVARLKIYSLNYCKEKTLALNILLF